MYRSSHHSYRGFALALTVALGLVAGMTITAVAEEASGGIPGAWLSSYNTARTAGMGGAFVATANEPLGAIWNPAGLSLMSQNQLSFETARLFENTSMNAFGFALPGRRLPSFGLSIVSLSSGDFERTNELNESMGTFSEGDMAFVFSASKSVTRRFALGANLKVVRQRVEEFDAAGVGGDIGALFDLTPALRIGASLLNLGGPNVAFRDADETYPVEFRGGFSFALFSGRGLLSAEMNHRDGPGATFHGGGEFWAHRKMALRFGISESWASGGFSYRVAPNMRFDYGASDHELGVTHRLALSYRFGGFFASSQADPPVFSPIGERSVTKFQLKTKTKAEADSWSLEIVDKSNQVVRRFGGKGVPPAHVMWDGKNEAGLPLPDGTYKYQFVVTDKDGNEFVAHGRTVEITTAGPQGDVPVIIE